jgi:hypothetical protein
MTSLIVLRKIRFGLNDDPRAFSPDELRSNQFACASKRVPPKKRPPNDLFFHARLATSLEANGAQCSRPPQKVFAL